MTSYVVSAKTGEGVALTFQKVREDRRGNVLYNVHTRFVLLKLSQPFSCLFPFTGAPYNTSLHTPHTVHPLLIRLPFMMQIAAELLGVRLSKAEQEQQQPVVTAEIVTFQETSLPKVPAAASPSTSTVCSVM